MKIRNIIILIMLLSSKTTFSQLNSGILPYNNKTEKVEWSGTIKKNGQSKSELYSKIVTWGISKAKEVIANDKENGILKINLVMTFKFHKSDFNMLYSATLISYDDSLKYTMTDCILLKDFIGIKTRRPFESINPKDKDFIKPFHEIVEKMNKELLELQDL